ncbi:MAG: hypothetical protein HRT61_07285 [Ekhidna sp.]|nr:hypothetical protein [Ekhidna sp.]
MDNLEDAIQNDANSIEGYFLKKIDFKINEQPIQLSLEDIHEEEDSFWITFKVETPKIWKSFYLEAGYLMELFPDQTNVVKVLGDNPQFFSLTRLKPYCSFTN